MSSAPRVQHGRRLTFFVPADLDGERLDRVLARLMPALSRSYLKKLAKEGLCSVNGRQAAPDQHVAKGDQVVLLLEQAVVPPCHPEPVPVRVLYEDAHTLVVFKPAGVVTHPAKGHGGGTLLNAVVGYLSDEIARGWARPHILTRLDKETSGVVLIAKTPQAHRALQRAIESRQINRKYLALVWGLLAHNRGQISLPLAPDRAGSPRMVLDERGKEAVTFYRVRRRFTLAGAEAAPGGITLVHLVLHTGRTHQIRAHLAILGHPVLGDRLYDPRMGCPAGPPLQELIEKIGGAALHAREVRFPDLSTGERRRVAAPPPGPFLDLLRCLHRVSRP